MSFIISMTAVVCVSTAVLLYQFVSGSLASDDAESAS
jgi:hypothetical protein